ncbi:type II toxin-antitoxin system PemK/MazF family toxin [Thiocapsa sp.]|uniref:type II toxin-antitoxin system PemK/MazF family toxin n=1 Tax=Thiocapsa sp. TaxID=2024551 RepID=UPI00359389D5
MERGDIYLVSLDPTSRHEQRGTRPVLAVSASAFNQLTRTPVVLPITRHSPRVSARHADRVGNDPRPASTSPVRPSPDFSVSGSAVSLMAAGTNTTGVVRCDQPRAMDLGSRNARKFESVPTVVMDEVLAKLAAILE